MSWLYYFSFVLTYKKLMVWQSIAWNKHINKTATGYLIFACILQTVFPLLQVLLLPSCSSPQKWSRKSGYFLKLSQERHESLLLLYHTGKIDLTNVKQLQTWQPNLKCYCQAKHDSKYLNFRAKNHHIKIFKYPCLVLTLKYLKN